MDGDAVTLAVFGSLRGLIHHADGFPAHIIQDVMLRRCIKLGRVPVLAAIHARRGFKCRLMPGTRRL